jgi:hypothetical protein
MLSCWAPDDAICAGEVGRATGNGAAASRREQLVRQRTMLVNALRAHLAEFGIVAGAGLAQC